MSRGFSLHQFRVAVQDFYTDELHPGKSNIPVPALRSSLFLQLEKLGNRMGLSRLYWLLVLTTA